MALCSRASTPCTALLRMQNPPNHFIEVSDCEGVRVGGLVPAAQEPGQGGGPCELSVGVDLAGRVGDPAADVHAIACELFTVDRDVARVLAHNAC